MPTVKAAKTRAVAMAKQTRDALDDMTVSHERALFGYTDRDSLVIIPGLLQKIADANGSIDIIKKDMTAVKKTIADVPEIVQLGRSIKKWGAWGVVAIIALLLCLVFRQYGLLPLILHAFGAAT